MDYNFSIVLYDNARGRSYIQQLCNASLYPKEVFLMPNVWEMPMTLKISDKVSFDIQESVHETIKKYSLNTINLKEASINAQDTVDKINKSQAKYVIFGGKGGEILKHDVLSAGKPILHIHPGITPDFRGSTTIYYSNLEGDNLTGCSAFFFNEKIDEGDIVLQQKFDMIKNIDIDYLYDPEIRGRTLVVAVKKLAKDFSSIPQAKNDNSLPYYIIHPVLKHLSILKNNGEI